MKHYQDPISTPLSDRMLSDELSKIREESTFNLARVRPGLTAAPQMSLADFRVYSTPYGIEVHFSQRRIRERLITVPSQTGTAQQILSDTTVQPNRFFETSRFFEPSQFFKTRGMALLTLASTVIFVGGAVATTGSIALGVIVAVWLPILLTWVATARQPKRDGKAILRISRLPNGRTLLTLKTVPPALIMSRSPDSHRPRIKKVAVRSTVQCTNLPVCLIKSSSMRSPISEARQVSFIFERGSQLRGSHQLRIMGSRQEIRWLCHHISEKCYGIV